VAQQTVTGTGDTVPGTAGNRAETVLGVSTGVVAANDLVQYNFYCNAQSTVHTVGVKVLDHLLSFRCQITT